MLRWAECAVDDHPVSVDDLVLERDRFVAPSATRISMREGSWVCGVFHDVGPVDTPLHPRRWLDGEMHRLSVESGA